VKEFLDDSKRTVFLLIFKRMRWGKKKKRQEAIASRAQLEEKKGGGKGGERVLRHRDYVETFLARNRTGEQKKPARGEWGSRQFTPRVKKREKGKKKRGGKA